MILFGWLACLQPNAHAFALLGPYASWMTPDLGYQQPGDIGGPMALGEGYRWNVPIVTYGFDQSFIQYFGQSGVSAVEQAIQIINALPPASSILQSNYTFNAARMNYRAESLSLLDLKSVTLPVLLEELGLTAPVRNIWTLRHWDANSCQWPKALVQNRYYFTPEASIPMTQFIAYYGFQRNYDPLSQQPSVFVNANEFDFFILSALDCSSAGTMPFLVNPSGRMFSSVCDAQAVGNPGMVYTGLTEDDVGGFAYLLSQSNICMEGLDDFTSPAAGNSNALIRTAPRPGVEKITFVPHPTDTNGNFLPATNLFNDSYFTNGALATQAVQRINSQPDFIFSAKDFGMLYDNGYFSLPAPFQRTDTSQWINNSALNGNPRGNGPGIIRSPVQITFHTPSRYIAAAGGTTNTDTSLWNWGSFSTSTILTVFPGNQTNITSLTLSLQVQSNSTSPVFQWTVLGHQRSVYQIDTSTNLIDWDPASTMTNTNGIFVFTYPMDQPRRYFRAILQ